MEDVARAAKLTTVLAERLTAQLLAGRPARDPIEVTRRLLAVQGQDPRGARLAVRARSSDLTAADVDRALNEGSLLITWVNRGTLHLLASEDYPWLHALTTPPLFTGSARRLAGEGLTPGAVERGVKAIERALASAGPLTRAQLREHIDAAAVRTEGQVLGELLMLASLQGIIVRGPVIDSQHAYVLVRDWLGVSPPVDRDRALAELARRYLAGHGPAEDRDLARWAGLPLRDARAALSSIARELGERPDGLVELAGSAGPPQPPPRACSARSIRCCSGGARARSCSEFRLAAGSGGGLSRSGAARAGARHLQLLLAERHRVPGVQLASAAGLALAVHQGRGLRQKSLGLAAAVDQAGELEQLSEPDRLPADGHLSNHCANVASGLRGRVRRAHG